MTAAPALTFDHYYRYDELTQALRDLAAAYPGLATLDSAGKSYEGRELWVMTLTNRDTGAPGDKPAMYIDGNHHAGEVTGSMVALYTIWHLLTEYGRDAQATHLLDTRTLYVLPRVSPDGAELYLTTPEMLRSSVRPWPFAEPQDGLTPDDINDDGRILQMRIEDPNGEWKCSDKDPRVMVRRRPDEFGGTYYRLYAEGTITNYDGYIIREAPPKRGLDFNRNYGSSSWKGEHSQQGSGPYPFSEPETRAVGEFLLNHPNVAGAMSYHTTGGVILRASCTVADDQLSPLDLRQFKELGQLGEEFTGYPCVSIFEEFTVDRSRPSVGSFIDFAYEERGILAFATELWDLQQRAGIPRRTLRELMNLTPRQLEEDSLKIVRWADENLGRGKGFIDWREFDHPQLGRVELGGFEVKYMRQNPPVELLEQECHKNMLFTLSHAAALPELVFRTVEVEEIAADVRVVRVVIENAGYQPTYVTGQAQKSKVTRPIKVQLELGDGAVLAGGDATVELDGLEGRVGAAGRFYALTSSFKRAARVEWAVYTEGSATATITVQSQRAGTLRRTVEL